MSRATKSEVASLCRRKGYELGSARLFLGIEWRIELYGWYDGRRAMMHQASDRKLALAYGDLAVWLRTKADSTAITAGAHHVSIDTKAKTGRRVDPPRSCWSCVCGAGDPKLVSPDEAHAAADAHLVLASTSKS